MRLVICRCSSRKKKIVVCSELHERVAIGQRSIRDISNILAVRQGVGRVAAASVLLS